MRKKHLATWFILMAITFSACKPDGANKEKQEEAPDKKIHPVRVMQLKLDTIDRHISYTANLVAFEELHYAPAQPGRIQTIHVEVGDRVSKEQVLVKMDPTQLTQALLQVENAQKTFRRMDTLIGLKSISEQQYEQAKTQYELAMANLEFLKENTTLTAPFNGIVTGRYYEAGEIYSGTPNTQAGKSAILTLMQINPLKAVVSVSEKFFPELQKGMDAVITTDIYPDKSFSGSVYKVHPTINPATRSFDVEIKVNNPGDQLRPGMFARVNINLKDEAAVLAPAIAVVKQEGTNNRHVFLYNQGKAIKARVKTGDRFDDRVELISENVRKGDMLIVAGQANLMDGDPVEIKK